jgi:hypothetical protein
LEQFYLLEYKAGNLQIRFPMRSLDFSFYLILPTAVMALGSTQPLTEISTRNLRGGKRAVGA